ncbi:MAG: hypothetical protein U0P30_03135 [Vicinamibacterales bacterium]
MTFEFDASTVTARDAAARCATSIVTPAAADIDRDGAVAQAVRAAARGALAPASAGVAWCATVEALAEGSAAVALTAASDVLGTSSPGGATWTGLRGFDVDGAGQALQASPAWQLAVTATITGVARTAIAAATEALKTAKAAGRSIDAASPVLSDAATAVEATRLLLFEAASMGAATAAETARALARIQAIEAVPLAFQAVTLAAGAEAMRPGTALERARRDATTLVDVLGDAAGAQAAAAAGVLPA